MSLVQKPAPGFKVAACMPDESFQDIDLASYKGKKYVVLYTYPADFTFVCASETVMFSKLQKEFDARNVQVLGCSIDTEHVHKAWKATPKEQGGIGPMTHPLLADVKKEIATAYGCLLDNGLALRGVFIIDKEGIVRAEMKNDLPLGRNVEEVLRIIDALKFHEESVATGKVMVCPAQWRKGKRAMEPTTEGVAKYFKEGGDQ
uniref:Thioredoxin domain-containing protein n=1 Tax=Pyrodinium bahamense TaxID=73915 RepID=A0A7S0AR59_9DINO|mmetsp:Transcript_4003/g.11158  ORF Transcript_4003/g.11158 Transcript_4003/m.11158 type:complete len:203 (-) Transcript_4003:69-677(-)